jgi:phage tail-like protein
MALGERKDPFLSFRFTVEVDQQVVAAFNDVTGLEFETEVETFREGGVNLHEQQLAGPNKFPSRLVLKRGITDDDTLWAWHQEVTQGKISRKDVSILLLDSTGEEQWRWNFRQALPVKWTGPQFRASNAEIAIETLELVHKGLVPG